MIGEELSAFLQEGIAIQLGTRNQHLEPDGVRVVAARVDTDGTHLTVFVPEIAGGHVVPDLEANGQAALVFSRPPDERTCQVKGIFAGTRAASEDERAFVEGQWSRWLDRLTTIGHSRLAYQHWAVWPCVAIRVRVTALFNQTPGPGAGAPLT